jgi:ubiquitin carboxyl-terminal hydrolase 7
MLVYIRESDKDKIMCNVDEKDIAEHLRIRLKKEQEEKEHKKKEKAEAHLYTIIKVARDEDLKEQIGKNIYFDLVDHEKVRSFRIQKQLPFTSFKEEVAKECGCRFASRLAAPAPPLHPSRRHRRRRRLILLSTRAAAPSYL